MAADGPSQTPMASPPELSELAARIEHLSPALQVVAFRKPGWQKHSKTPLLLGGHSLEVKDTETGEIYIITTEKLFADGLATLDEAQGRYLRSVRGRMLGAAVFVVGLLLLGGAASSALALPPAVVLVIAGVWLWLRANRARPAGWPSVRESIGLLLRGRNKPNR